MKNNKIRNNIFHFNKFFVLAMISYFFVLVIYVIGLGLRHKAITHEVNKKWWMLLGMSAISIWLTMVFLTVRNRKTLTSGQWYFLLIFACFVGLILWS